MDKFDRLPQIVEELRRMREDCEPKNKDNPRYHKYSNAISSLLWIIKDLKRESGPA